MLDAIERERAAEPSWGCIVFDLDGFKRINDTHGHHRGDEILVSMAWFLREPLEDTDVVVRLGGDEFLVLLRGADESRTLRVKSEYDASLARAPIPFSLGTACVRAGQALAQGIQAADAQLYKNRALRRGAVSKI